ncbi:DUF1015 family protein [Modestobacter roseus]|uniref:Uncharacterized protein (DUF1015 family) n=1 Tax=Modestobacter roseus TaxID=1181884 RepID=A0A562IPW4_9ACTN|nr:DUF1015 domain-containing protein [Modestobacter roseus]TWH72634.1 uncharacterized protein (DUF1015 family) [Modestobacter roseus]
MPTPTADAPPSAATGLDVRPFRALVYREHDPARLARVSSPAYDLVTVGGRDRLAEADPHNIVRLILPHVDPVPGGRAASDRSSARAAAANLRQWLADRVLVREDVAALWRYEMAAPGLPATTGWLGAVRVPPAGSPAVLPHEDTFAPAVEGRRALLDETRTDLEPIVLAHDPEPEVAELTRHSGQGAPTLEVTDPDGVTHRLWRVTDRAVLQQLTTALGRTQAVIADGHHRFAAARAHQTTGGSTRCAVLAFLTPTGPGGLRVQAIHRVVPDLSLPAAVEAAATGLTARDVTPADGELAEVCRRWARGADGTAETGRGPVFLVTDGTRVVELSIPTAALRATVPTEAPTAWRELDVVLAHHGLLSHLWHRADDPTSVLVAHDVDQALRLAGERSGVALLLRSPAPADVAAVARSGARMPRKSTLFVPKPRTGLVLRPHED